MSNNVKKYIRENIGIISKIIGVYIIGIIIGIIFFNLSDIKMEYTNVVKEAFDMSRLENFEGINVIGNGIKNNCIYIVILYSSLVTIFTPLMVLFLVLLKSISTGMYICSLFSIFGFLKGLEVVFLSVVIPCIISISAYTILCTNIILVYKKIASNEKIDIRDIVKHGYFLLIAVSLISFSIVIEQLITSVCLNIYINIG